MDNWRQTLAQLRDLANGLRPRQRLALVVVPLGVLSGLILILTGGYGSRHAAVLDGKLFAPEELRSAREALAEAGLQHQIKVAGRQILAPQAELARYNAVLRAASGGRSGDNQDQVLENVLSAFLSENERQARMDKAKARDLVESIQNAYPEIGYASLFVDRGRSGVLARSQKMTATLIVVPREGAHLSNALAEQLRPVVAHAYSGLTCENVAVINRQQTPQALAPVPEEIRVADTSRASTSNEKPANRTTTTGNSANTWRSVKGANIRAILTHWTIPLAATLALASLLWLLRRSSRSRIATTPSAAAESTASPVITHDTRRDRLEELVRENPVAAAAVINRWLAAES